MSSYHLCLNSYLSLSSLVGRWSGLSSYESFLAKVDQYRLEEGVYILHSYVTTITFCCNTTLMPFAIHCCSIFDAEPNYKNLVTTVHVFTQHPTEVQ